MAWRMHIGFGMRKAFYWGSDSAKFAKAPTPSQVARGAVLKLNPSSVESGSKVQLCNSWFETNCWAFSKVVRRINGINKF